MKTQLDLFVQQNLSRMIDDIRRLTAVESVKGPPGPGMPFGPGPAQAMDCMAEIAAQHGFSSAKVGDCVLEIDLNGGPDELGILCHLDVVPAGEGWSSPPFEAVVRDGRLYGRGTADNKGPAVAALYALKFLRESHIPLQKNVRLMLGTDEESGSEDLKRYFQLRRPPKYNFSPDAAFPVYNIEKGKYTPVFSFTKKEFKTLNSVLSLCGGSAVNVVPDSACAVVQGFSADLLSEYSRQFSDKTGVSFHCEPDGPSFRITARGVGTHASYPEDGNNALTALLQLVSALPLSPSAGHDRLRKLAALVPHGDYLGKALGVAMSDPLSGPLTCNLGLLEYTPDGIRGALDIRCPLCSTPQNTAQAVNAAFEKAGFQVEAPDMILPHHIPEDLPFVQTLLRAFETHTSLKGECLAMGGGTYVHGMENSVAFGAAFPDTDTFAHAADEYAVIEELAACVKIFAQVIYDVCR